MQGFFAPRFLGSPPQCIIFIRIIVYDEISSFSVVLGQRGHSFGWWQCKLTYPNTIRLEGWQKRTFFLSVMADKCACSLAFTATCVRLQCTTIHSMVALFSCIQC